MISKVIRFFKPEEFAWTRGELFFMRAAIACVIFFCAANWGLTPFQLEKEKLNGLAKLIPLAWMTNAVVLILLKILTAVGLALFVFGIAPVLTLFPAVLAVCGLGALRNSKGDISHSTQVTAMALVGIWVVYLVRAVMEKSWKKPTKNSHYFSMLAALMMIAASYTASGIVKLKASNGQWIQRVPNMAVQMVKSNLADYYSKPEGDVSVVLAQKAPAFLTEHSTLSKFIFGSGLVLELGALVMLLGRRWNFIWGGGLLLMHICISWLMDIEFWNHMWLLAILCVVPGIAGLFKRKPASDELVSPDSLEEAA